VRSCLLLGLARALVACGGMAFSAEGKATGIVVARAEDIEDYLENRIGASEFISKWIVTDL